MTLPLSILLIEDDEDDALLIMAETQLEGRDVTFHRVETESGLCDALQASQWDAVLADYQLPQFNGLAALKIVNQHDPDLPFLLVSGAMVEETAVEAMRKGAHDYIMKGHLALLAPALERELHEAAERRARRQAEAERDHLLIQEQHARKQVEASVIRIARLKAVIAALSTAVTPEDVAMAVVNHGVVAVGARGGGVVTLSEDGRSLHPLFMMGYPPEVLDSYQGIALDADLPLATVVRTGKPLWIPAPAVATARYAGGSTGTQQIGTYAAAVLPLLLSGRAVGGIEFTFGDDRVFGEDDRAFAVDLAQQCAQALDRASLYKSVWRSEQRYRALVETSPDGILLNDMHGIIVMANAQLARMLGYESPNDLRGVHIEKHLPDDNRQQALEMLEQRASGTLPSSVNTRYSVQRRDGSTFPAEISSYVAPGAPGEAGFVTSTVRDVTDRVAYEAQLQRLALHDPLTGLANRTLLYDRLEQTLAWARRNSESLAVLLVDLDRFKEINDSFGHQVGDKVIREVGLRLSTILRASDTLARMGGDEFAILLPDTDLHGAVHTATKLCHALAQPIEVDDQRLFVGTSVGITLFPDHARDPDIILRYADVAMYSAKQANSDYAVYAIEKDSYSPKRLALNGELRDAIESDNLVLHFQPKMRLSSTEIDGMEALVRWNHPEHGLIPPDEFIPLAEHSGLIRPLTTWVIDRALSQCRVWQDLNLALGVSVNLSARSLQDPDLPSIILRSLVGQGVDPSHLTLEITESVIMADPDHAMDMLAQLTDVGVKLSIDDFGTGYSSLAYLRHLRAHELKIDKSFVMDLDTNVDSGFIVRSVIDLGHNLGLEVVAEGVESQASLDILAALKCNRAQGYHLSRPRPAADVTHWLQERKTLQDALRHERPMHITLIEDEVDVVELLEAVLTLEGYSVTVLNGPGHVNALSPSQRPDLFLIDIMLPGASGIEVAEQLHSQGFEDVPMIAMSASDRMLKVAAGSNLFSAGIGKPFDLGELVPLVTRCIASRTP